MLLARDTGSLMYASAATKAVAAVPYILLVLLAVFIEINCTYGVLHACHKDSLRVKPLPVLPVNPCHSYRVLGAHCPTQS